MSEHDHRASAVHDAHRGSRESAWKTKDGLRDEVKLHGPVQRYGYRMLPKPMKTHHREGFGYSIRECDKWVYAYGWATSTEQALMNIMSELESSYEAADALWKKYADRLKEFRSVVKNDVTSIEAAARKTTEAVHKMNAAYGHVIAQLNSDEMAQAVANAERLAAAMQALASLQSHRLVLSVAEQDKTT